MARFYADEDFPLPAVKELRNLQHDVLTAREAGNANKGIEDPDVLKYATQEKRILLTNNRADFLALDKNRTADHAGIVVCTLDPKDPAGLARRIDGAAAGVDMTNQVARVNRPNLQQTREAGDSQKQTPQASGPSAPPPRPAADSPPHPGAGPAGPPPRPGPGNNPPGPTPPPRQPPPGRSK